MVNKALYK